MTHSASEGASDFISFKVFFFSFVQMLLVAGGHIISVFKTLFIGFHPQLWRPSVVWDAQRRRRL